MEAPQERQALLLIQDVEIHTEICGFAANVTHFSQEVKFFFRRAQNSDFGFIWHYMQYSWLACFF